MTPLCLCFRSIGPLFGLFASLSDGAPRLHMRMRWRISGLCHVHRAYSATRALLVQYMIMLSYKGFDFTYVPSAISLHTHDGDRLLRLGLMRTQDIRNGPRDTYFPRCPLVWRRLRSNLRAQPHRLPGDHTCIHFLEGIQPPESPCAPLASSQAFSWP